MQCTTLYAQVVDRLLDAGISDEEAETLARDFVSGILGSARGRGRCDGPRDDHRLSERSMNAQHTPEPWEPVYYKPSGPGTAAHWRAQRVGEDGPIEFFQTLRDGYMTIEVCRSKPNMRAAIAKAGNAA